MSRFGPFPDPAALLDEMHELTAAGVDLGNLWLSDRAQILMPYHRQLDGLEEMARGGRAIGTTKRGIGPAYADKAARWGVRLGDLKHQAWLRERLEQILPHKNQVLQQAGTAILAQARSCDARRGRGQAAKISAAAAARLASLKSAAPPPPALSGLPGPKLNSPASPCAPVQVAGSGPRAPKACAASSTKKAPAAWARARTPSNGRGRPNGCTLTTANVCGPMARSSAPPASTRSSAWSAWAWGDGVRVRCESSAMPMRCRQPRDGTAGQLAGTGCFRLSFGHGLPGAAPCRVQ